MKLPLQILIVLLTVTTGCATDLSSRRVGNSHSMETGLLREDSNELPFEKTIEIAPAESVASDRTAPIEGEVLKTEAAEEEASLDDASDDSTGAGEICGDGIGGDGLLPFEEVSSEQDLGYRAHTWKGISREEIRQQAINHHPAVAQAQANYEALKGKYQQAGLAPNPTAGIIGSDINEGGGAGRYGVFFGREVVRGGKLIAAQNVVCAELESAGQRLEIIKRRLLTDVDRYYYEVLVAQEQVALAKRLLEVSQTAAQVSDSLFAAQEVPQTSVLQSKLELRKSEMAVRRCEASHLSATRKLAAIIGEEGLPTPHVAGNARQIAELKDFESAYDQLLRDSPELSKLFADIEANKRQLVRDRVEPISNVTWQTSFLYDFVTDDVVGGFQVGWEIPKFDRNEGAIYQSSQRIVAAERRMETKALDLRRRLAEAYERYLDAQIQVDAYENEILPIATETVELLMLGYRAGETEVLELLVSQRALFQTNLAYLQNLRTLWQQTAAIEGLLLDDGLSDQGP